MAHPTMHEMNDLQPDGSNAPGDVEKTAAAPQKASTAAVAEHAQRAHVERAGVGEMEDMRALWTKKWLLAAYSAIVVIHFVNSLQQSAAQTFNPYVTSHFKEHGLTAIASVVANLIGGITKLPLAMFIDIVGRSQGFFMCSVLIVLALFLMTICQNVATYAAAQVFSHLTDSSADWSGMNGVHYVLEIFIADTCRLQNRLIWFAIASLPYVANSFLGSTVGDFFLHHSTWRWGFASFAIVTAVAALSFWSMFWFVGLKAKSSRVKRKKSNRTILQSVQYWCIEFDVVGLLLVSGGFSLLLLPFSLAQNQKTNYASPMIISMIIVGLILLALFPVWEKKGAQKNFFPFHLMKDRSVAGACLLGLNNWIAFYSYRNFYSSYLQTVFQLSVAKAGWIISIYSVVSSFWAVIISIAFKYTDRYKWGALVAVPVQITMTGLLIHLRSPGSSLAILVVVEVIAAFCSATMLQVEQVAIMASVPHENMAVGLALLFTLQAVGGAIGSAISGALWTQIVPKKIEMYLPPDSKIEATKLYDSLEEILALPWNSPVRQAVVRAYSDGQKIMLICGTCAFLPCLVWMCMLRNHRMSARPFGKGTPT